VVRRVLRVTEQFIGTCSVQKPSWHVWLAITGAAMGALVRSVYTALLRATSMSDVAYMLQNPLKMWKQSIQPQMTKKGAYPSHTPADTTVNQATTSAAARLQSHAMISHVASLGEVCRHCNKAAKDAACMYTLQCIRISIACL
jgi:hypothetical protein